LAIGRTRRQKRNALKAAAKRILTVVVIGVLIIASMYVYNYLTTSERFAIREVQFRGMSRVDATEIEEMLTDLIGQNILLVPLDSYAERIKMHPRVERVSMNRVLPGKINCVVEEREPVALIFTDRFLEVDRYGMVMAEDEFSEMLDLPIITGLPKSAVTVGKVNSNPRLRNALDALAWCKRLGGGFADDISELMLSSRGVSIRSLEKDCVLLLGDSDYENRLKKYFLLKKTLAEREPSAKFIDLRFDDQVVLRGRL
jgi:cell division septal protein FtsQ